MFTRGVVQWKLNQTSAEMVLLQFHRSARSHARDGYKAANWAHTASVRLVYPPYYAWHCGFIPNEKGSDQMCFQKLQCQSVTVLSFWATFLFNSHEGRKLQYRVFYRSVGRLKVAATPGDSLDKRPGTDRFRSWIEIFSLTHQWNACKDQLLSLYA